MKAAGPIFWEISGKSCCLPPEFLYVIVPEAGTLAREGGSVPKAVGASRGSPQDHGLHRSNKAADLAWRQGNAEEEE